MRPKPVTEGGRPRRARRRARLTLDALPFSNILDLLWGWAPPATEFARSCSRWQTWDDYCRDYEDVRAELLAHAHLIGHWNDGEPPFAEAVYQQWKGR
jgi:hypothetical protein